MVGHNAQIPTADNGTGIAFYEVSCWKSIIIWSFKDHIPHEWWKQISIPISVFTTFLKLLEDWISIYTRFVYHTGHGVIELSQKYLFLVEHVGSRLDLLSAWFLHSLLGGGEVDLMPRVGTMM